jgi:LmbE family N-acetylglucosaminyl deacetylase
MMRMDAMRQAWRDLPVAGIEDILQGRTPIILAPHPDDESLGCGGLIAQACAIGLPPQVIIVTDGTGSHRNSPSYPAARLRRTREAEVEAALRLLGLPRYHLSFLGLSDAAMPSAGPDIDEAARTIISLCKAEAPSVLLATWRHDPHCDHEATAVLAVDVASRAGIPLLSYPVWGWTLADDAEVDEPLPRGWRLEISEQLGLKQQAIQAHATQYGDLIQDDPSGFRLPESLLTPFRHPYEVFLAS